MGKRQKYSVNLDDKRDVRPDFEAWNDFDLPARSLWNHPLLRQGGVTAIAIVAIFTFGFLALKCLDADGMGETARLLGFLILCGLILTTVVVTARFVREESSYAKDQASSQRSAQPRNQSKRS